MKNGRDDEVADIRAYVGEITEDNLGRLAPCFRALLMDARQATGRDLDTGEVQDPDGSRHLLGAVAYLILLDQVGTAVRPTGSITKGNGVLEALRHFAPSLTEPEREAIYALRNALAHDYALSNKSSRPSRQHRFVLGVEENISLVELPAQPWNGEYDTGRLGDPTMVNLKKLGDLSDSIAVEVERRAHAGELELAKGTGSTAELLVRYTLHIIDEE